MAKPFQLSIVRIFVAIALIGSGFAAMSMSFRHIAIHRWDPDEEMLGLWLIAWALFSASVGVLLRRSIRFIAVLAAISGMVGAIGTLMVALAFRWVGLE